MQPRSALDFSRFPLVVLDLPSTIDVGMVDQLEADHRLLFSRGSKYVSLCDTRRVTSLPDAKARKRIGEWVKSHESEFARWQVANALIVSSSMVRAGLAAIHWFAPPPIPTCVEVERGAAEAFLETHAKRAGLVLPGLATVSVASGFGSR